MSRVSSHRKAQAEAVSYFGQRSQIRRDIERGHPRSLLWNLIRGHDSQSFWREQAHAIEFTAIDEHLTKASVIRSGGEQSAAAGEPLHFVLRQIRGFAER